ncbi:hypothetical protein GCM10010405_45060 [Streptomyces macrosporus]|uniref:Uncharacterized protein n=1 Tax=Streptomyces macrosporus TaxID=44032 RepID=A0ABP5XHC6_9ACTN
MTGLPFHPPRGGVPPPLGPGARDGARTGARTAVGERTGFPRAARDLHRLFVRRARAFRTERERALSPEPS